MTDSIDDNLSEYDNPEWYDAENQWAADDDFFLEIAQRVGGPVLDIACGTGRLTRAIAEAGIDVTGLDIDRGMLGRARDLSGNLDIDWILGDCRTMELGRQFQLALMTSHGFQHLLTDSDQDDFLERSRDHLVPGGYFAFESRNPDALTSPREFGEEEHWRSFQLPDGRWVDVSTQVRYDPESQLEHFFMRRTIRESGETESGTVALRFRRVDELNDLLDRYGFKVNEQYGFWDRRPVTPDSHEIITVCQRVR